MTTDNKSSVIYKGRHYTACAMKDGSLIVTRNGKQKGFQLIGDSASHWIDAIKTALDDKERAFICKAMTTEIRR